MLDCLRPVLLSDEDDDVVQVGPGRSSLDQRIRRLVKVVTVVIRQHLLEVATLGSRSLHRSPVDQGSRSISGSVGAVRASDQAGYVAGSCGREQLAKVLDSGADFACRSAPLRVSHS